MSQQLVKDNKHTYPRFNTRLQGTFEDHKGPNLFGRHLPYYSLPSPSVQSTITGISNVITALSLNSSDYDTSFIKYNISGTFTKNIEDGILYYQITSVNPDNGPSVIIPANPYSNTDNINATLYQHRNNSNFIGLYVKIFAVTHDNKEVTFKVNIAAKPTSY